MLYAVICTDKPGHIETRKANRDAHLAYLAETNARMAGPFLDEAGAMTGSLVVIEAMTARQPRPGPRMIPTPRPGCSRRSASRHGRR